MKRENIGKLILSLISLLILIELILYVNPSKLIIEIKKIHTEAIFIAFLLANIATLFRVLKWWVLIDNISIKELIPIQLAGMMISNLTPGKVGEPIKAFILKSLKGINVSESLQSIIWERTLDLIVLLIFTLIGIVLFSKLLKFSIVGIFISIIVITLLILVARSEKIGRKFSKIKWIRKYINEEFVDAFYNSKIKKEKIIISFILTVITWFLDGLVYFVLFSSLSPVGAEYVIIFPALLSISIVIGISSMLPGGLGGTEASFIIIFSLIGTAKTIAAAIVFVGRALTLGYGMILGYISFLYLNKKLDILSGLRR